MEEVTKFNPDSKFATPDINEMAIPKFSPEMKTQLSGLLVDASKRKLFRTKDDYERAKLLYARLNGVKS